MILRYLTGLEKNFFEINFDLTKKNTTNKSLLIEQLDLVKQSFWCVTELFNYQKLLLSYLYRLSGCQTIRLKIHPFKLEKNRIELPHTGIKNEIQRSFEIWNKQLTTQGQIKLIEEQIRLMSDKL